MYSLLAMLSRLTPDFDNHGHSKYFDLSTNETGTLWWKKFIFVYAFQVVTFDAHNFTVPHHKQVQKHHKTCSLGLEIYLPFLILEKYRFPHL
jgi:hypothetical protein